MQETKPFQNHTTNQGPVPGSDRLSGALKRKFVLGIFIIIVPVLGFLFTWLSVKLQDQAKEEALGKARVVADQIILTRQWITDCMGGVFVHTASPGAKAVTYATKDQIITKHGNYQLFTPSMVTKKLSQYSYQEKSYQFRLTSLTPLNRDNIPDPFETRGLNLFGQRMEKEYYRFSDKTLDYMVPLYKTRGCVKCHASENILKTDIIGGLRITIPFEKIRKTFKKNQYLLGLTGLVITLVTTGVLVVLVRFLILRPLEELEEKSRQLSSGDLSSRVTLHTRDELERLGQNFNIMAESLSRHRDDLEEKVAKATRDLAQANHELMKLDKLKSDFLANMSHELRTPLTAVRGSIDYLKRKGQSSSDDRDYILIIEKNISRLTRLIANLFDFTKLEAGKIDWEFEKEDISQLVEEVIEIMGPIARKKKIELAVDTPGPLFTVIDLERMEQVLVNLLDNAIKFSGENTRVSARVIDRYDGAEIRISDQGPGIDVDNPVEIFQKFYTSDSSSKDSRKGAGMGLAICKAIVNAHKGEIYVTRENNTTCFTISLPKETP
ncbi:MAG: ATP-binding protein [Desulfobacterales bacterium]|nr:ATP-binding protein [Desulfobacterales bacterium]